MACKFAAAVLGVRELTTVLPRAWELTVVVVGTRELTAALTGALEFLVRGHRQTLTLLLTDSTPR